MDVNQRLKYLETGTMKGVNVSAIVESHNMGIAWVKKFKVSSLENAEEDICKILSDDADMVFVKTCRWVNLMWKESNYGKNRRRLLWI